MDTVTMFERARETVLRETRLALEGIDAESAARFVEYILNARKVFCTGVGRVLLSLQAFVKRLAHLGIDAHYVGEITEPALTKDDLLITGSGSGESIFPLSITKKAKQLGAAVVHIGSNPKSSMAEYTDLLVRIPVRTKLALDDEIDSQQPMTSLFEQSLLLFGDSIARVLVEKKGLDLHKLWQYHANLE
ncbi:MAG: SIS domain-containing protein [Treponema sp.]|jgi:6-phospho-3-hexuloisomerase|nr:SIS domain-containing protein [Treponema sp.]